MGTGYLKIIATTGDDAIPVAGARVIIRKTSGEILYETSTDANGSTGVFPLSAPDMRFTLDPGYQSPAYSVCDVEVSAEGFITKHIHNVEIVDTQTSILPVRMTPLEAESRSIADGDIFISPMAMSLPAHMTPEAAEARHITDEDTYIPPMALLLPAKNRQIGPLSGPSVRDVIIPDYITVHLGAPTNASARNVRVKFPDYIKNVVSSEIYSTWPTNSLIANIHVITTFALNRVYTEWYRSRGFNFDITNSTSYDQYYRDGAQIFENISRLVDGIFNVYARRFAFKNPFFTQFCNGTTVTCPGLSQWGTVTLANQGKTPLEILRYYYPNDLELVSSNNITGITESYPGTPLRVGSQGESVQRMQNYLNRIRVNFPLIPVISNPNGVFGADTADAVRAFQRSFNLTADGIIGRETWNKISFLYVGVTRLAELDGEGERVGIGANPPNVVLSQGSRGAHVLELQFILNYISPFYPTIPTVIKDGVFGPSVKNAVIEFQKTFGLTQDGVVGPGTWNKLYSVYRGIEENAPIPNPPAPPPTNAPPYPGAPLRIGSTGPNVRLMQTYLNTIRIVYPSIPYLIVDGTFGEGMKNSVIAFQQEFILTPDGVIGPITWDEIVKQYLIATGNISVSLEYPGTPLMLGSTGSAVRLMQGFLSELHSLSQISSQYPSLPPVTVDGIFGPLTRAAVIAFQSTHGLVPDGIIGPITWNAIINARNQSV